MSESKERYRPCMKSNCPNQRTARGRFCGKHTKTRQEKRALTATREPSAESRIKWMETHESKTVRDAVAASLWIQNKHLALAEKES